MLPISNSNNSSPYFVPTVGFSTSEPEKAIEVSPTESAVAIQTFEKTVSDKIDLTKFLQIYREQRSCNKRKGFNFAESQLAEIFKNYDTDPRLFIKVLFEVFLDRLQAFGGDLFLEEVAHKQNEAALSIKKWKKYIELFFVKVLEERSYCENNDVIDLAFCYHKELFLSNTDYDLQKRLDRVLKSDTFLNKPEKLILILLNKAPQNFNEKEIDAFVFATLKEFSSLPSFGRVACQDHIRKLMFAHPETSLPMQVETYAKIRLYDRKSFEPADMEIINLLWAQKNPEVMEKLISLIRVLFTGKDDNFLVQNKAHLFSIREIIYEMYSFAKGHIDDRRKKRIWEENLLTVLTLTTPDKTPLENLFKQFSTLRKQKTNYLLKDFFKGIKAHLPSHHKCKIRLLDKLSVKDAFLRNTLNVEKRCTNDIWSKLWSSFDLEKSFFSWEECLRKVPDLLEINAVLQIAETFFVSNSEEHRAMDWAQMIYDLTELKSPSQEALKNILKKIEEEAPEKIAAKVLPFFLGMAPSLFCLKPERINSFINTFGLDKRYVKPIVSMISQSNMEIFNMPINPHDPVISKALLNLAFRCQSEAKNWSPEMWNVLFDISLSSCHSVLDNSGMSFILLKMSSEMLENNMNNVLSFVANNLSGWNRLRSQKFTIKLLDSLPTLNPESRAYAEEMGIPSLILLHEKKFPEDTPDVSKLLEKICTEETFFHLTSIKHSPSDQYWIGKVADAKEELRREIGENSASIDIERSTMPDSTDLGMVLKFTLKKKAKIACLELLNHSAQQALNKLSLLEATKRSKNNSSLKYNYNAIVNQRIICRSAALEKFEEGLSHIDDRALFMRDLQISLLKASGEVRKRLNSELLYQLGLVQTAEDEISREINELFTSIIESNEPLIPHKTSAVSPEQRIVDRINQLGQHTLIAEVKEAPLQPAPKGKEYAKKLKVENTDMRKTMEKMQKTIDKLQRKNEALQRQLENTSQNNVDTMGECNQETMPELLKVLEDLSFELVNSQNPILSNKYQKIRKLLNTRTNTVKDHIELAEQCGIIKRGQTGSHVQYSFKLENEQTLQGTNFTIAAHSSAGQLSEKAIKQILLCILRVMEHEKASAKLDRSA